jgi:hypothetical protein
VVEVLGDINAPGVDTQVIIRKYAIPDQHGAEANEEARRLARGRPGQAVEASRQDIAGRTDFRCAGSSQFDAAVTVPEYVLKPMSTASPSYRCLTSCPRLSSPSAPICVATKKPSPWMATSVSEVVLSIGPWLKLGEIEAVWTPRPICIGFVLDPPTVWLTRSEKVTVLVL